MVLLVGSSFIISLGLIVAGVILAMVAESDGAYVGAGLAWVAAAIALLATVRAAALCEYPGAGGEEDKVSDPPG